MSDWLPPALKDESTTLMVYLSVSTLCWLESFKWNLSDYEPSIKVYLSFNLLVYCVFSLLSEHVLYKISSSIYLD